MNNNGKASMKILAILFLALTLTTSVTLAQGGTPLVVEEQSAGELVELLWSPDHAQRRAAKRKLLKIGPSAVPLLLLLLEDIYTNPLKQRFPKGREEEAQQALVHYKDHSPEYLSSLEISWRLRDDAAQLLGQLHAAEAVPILIKLMHRQLEAAWPRGLSKVMRALVRIGAPAVPNLIKEIENAPIQAHSLVFIENATSESSDKLRLGEQNDQMKSLRREVAIIRIRAALVLGEIADVRALPVLENLLDPTREPLLLDIEADYMREAIRRIRKKSRQ